MNDETEKRLHAEAKAWNGYLHENPYPHVQMFVRVRREFVALEVVARTFWNNKELTTAKLATHEELQSFAMERGEYWRITREQMLKELLMGTLR